MSFRGLFESAKKSRDRSRREPTPGDTAPQRNRRRRHHQDPDQAPGTTSGTGASRKRGAERTDSSHGNGHKKRKRRVVSQSALELSAKLKDLSRQKQLDQVLQLYWSCSKDDRDVHHACMVIDCCARCGNVLEAERVFDQAMRDTNSCSVEMHTALMKAFCHAGRMDQADQLFHRMCLPQSKVLPNVRTLNTLLRGCLWTAACLGDPVVVGGVVTSERAWQRYNERVGGDSLDSSSYEYSISLLCQALRGSEALRRMEEFMERSQIHHKGVASFRGGDQASLETLAAVNLSLAKANGLRGKWEDTWRSCQRALNAVEGSKAKLAAESSSTSEHSHAAKHKHVTGGKKSWKAPSEVTEQRMASNSSYRSHRLTEIQQEARALLGLRTKRPDLTATEAKSLSRILLTRLLYFSGGGTTELSKSKGKGSVLDRETQQQRLFVPAWHSYGLRQMVYSDSKVELESTPNARKIYKQIGLDKEMKKMIGKDGRVKFDELFADSGRPLDLELGSGFGEWVVKQAQSNPKRNYIAVELRADRVFQIMTKSTLLLGLSNLCVVGSDCESFLRSQVTVSCVSNVYVNHPEPPTQTFGGSLDDLNAVMNGGAEPAHMLCSSSLVAVIQVLKPGGRICITSDNRWYSRLICATIIKAKRASSALLKTLSIAEAKEMGLSCLESFQQGVTLYQRSRASTSEEHRDGVTYFDRLWQTGAGKHAEKTTRFVIIVEKQ